ncbi:tubulin monoglutamylase TTLL4-like isoform X2 [Diorhabda sublineata]|uniref:tubulin monoglutamylase TTLL4-like isoform X2 n=1 Tax=Diorhabda sublineata TaxID=1163346 RepID=UPI0024E0C161|nr:tubulin monoglutamylase TTLL4-like isoform X2 [Diorhabda sublineata]XP_056634233.1 tubulin monoglutamylase TTLL4-like isoform X2 [Diorhabda sublineata]XP_056634234.1 tubulin monoglutamylase TTLL4-like isoform X2 [Diorhabda sublineata]
MGDCNLDLYNQKEKFSYTPWCSMCEKGPQRRRSISETNEPCRRKSKELKTLTPKKYNRSQEYENMEFEYELKGQWQEKDMRYEFSRIRSNLCELPTSYISNNCQLSNNLTGLPKLSNEPTGFDCFKGAGAYETAGKFVDINDQIENLGNMQSKTKTKLEPIKLSKIEIPSGQRKREVRSPDKFCNFYQYNLNSRQHLQSKSDILEKYPAPQKSKTNPSTSPFCNEYCMYTNFKMHTLSSQTPVCFDTSTYFNRRNDTIPDKYNREIQDLREKLLSLKSNCYNYRCESSEGNPSPSKGGINTIKTRSELTNAQSTATIDKHEMKAVTDINLCKSIQKETPKSLQLQCEVDHSVTPSTPGLKTNRSKVSLKTRIKVNNHKMKKGKSKTLHTLPAITDDTNSDCSGSDSENETNIDDIDNLEDGKNEDSSESCLSLNENETGSGDAVNWPLRPSLFPNIPPYIKFRMFSSEVEVKIPNAKKFFKWKLSTITPMIVRKTLTNTGFVLVRKSNQWLGTWGKHMKSPMFKTLKETQKLNHFPGTFQLGRKDRLWRNFQRMILKFGVKEFGFLPHTYILPQELKLLKQCWEYKNGNGGEMWIIKPPASARGAGIKVINKWSQLPKKSSLIVQKYISNPYLINDSKFDLRLYVLVTSFNPLIIYMYKEGLARFASAKYSSNAKDLKDRYMHLTNYSINKFSSQYTANEDANSCQGHKWTISKLMEYLQDYNVDTKALWKNLQQLVIKTIIACESPVVELCEENINSRYNCYELFGIDILLDDNFKPWLLEVNISPSLHSASPLDAYVKGPLVQSIFDMAQFHLPSRIRSQKYEDMPEGFDTRFYSTALTKKEKNKHSLFEQLESRDEYLVDILRTLTGDDVRHLARAEDELQVTGNFERIFPTPTSHKYLHYLAPRYYNRLFDAWEERYGHQRETGIAVLRNLCNQRIHLKVPLNSTLIKARNFMLDTIQSVCSQCRKFAEYDPFGYEGTTIQVGTPQSSPRRYNESSNNQ